MHRCKFCVAEYQPRPQVKNPTACPKPECQCKRQRANERAWRQLHERLYDGEYHRIRRGQRERRLHVILQSILRCLEVGAQFLKQTVEWGTFSGLFGLFMSELGIRRANKLWHLEIRRDHEGIG